MRATSSESLPIDARPVRAQDAWSIRLPVRAEEVTISRQTVVTERVRLQRRQVHDVERVDAVVRREQLQTRESGAAEIKRNE